MLDAVIIEELKELNFDINLQDIVYQELLEETQIWALAHLSEEETNYLGEQSDVIPFFCPICQKAVMASAPGYNSCNECELRYVTTMYVQCNF